MANVDLGTFIANSEALERENLTRLLVKLTQGMMIWDKVFPIASSTDAFIWHVEAGSSEFVIPKEVGEKGEANSNSFEYEKLTDSVKDFYEKITFSEKELRSGNTYNFISPLQRGIMALANKLKLAVENDFITEVTDTTKYTGINTYDVTASSTAWSDTANSDPVQDIQEIKLKIQQAAQLTPDTIVLGVKDYHNLTSSSAIRNSNAYTKDVIGDVEVERIASLRIIVSNSIKKDDEGTASAILDGKGIVLASGMAGEIRESKALRADRDYDKDNRSLMIYAERSFKTIVTQPKFIGILLNLQ